MNPLTIVIPVETSPLCPMCRVDLLGQVIRVYGNVVFCARCINSWQYFVLNRVIRRCRNSVFNGLFVCHSGLLVLCPKSHVDHKVLDHLWDFESTDSQYDYPQFIGIVPDGYFKENIGPARTVSNPRHPSHVPEALPPMDRSIRFDGLAPTEPVSDPLPPGHPLDTVLDSMRSHS